MPYSHLQHILDLIEGTDNCVFLETTRVSEDDHRSYLFLEPCGMITCTAADDPGLFLEIIRRQVEQGHHVAGWFSYEFGYLLEPVLGHPPGSVDQIVAEFGVYGPPVVFDHRTGSVSGSLPQLKRQNGEKGQTYTLEGMRLNLSQAEYETNVSRIKEYIAAGDTYQVNYTMKLLFEFTGSDGALYQSLRRNQSVSFGAMIKTGQRRILSFSPELFFKKIGDRCLVRPMKGTSPRGRDLGDDQRISRSLAQDPKNRSENVMIVDLLRNDLGRLCQMGSVQVDSLFDVESYETLLQMTSTISGSLRPDIKWPEIFRALFPCGSVTGAPKIRTMEIIRELEGEARGVYTGGIGFIGPDGNAVFNVPIRTVSLQGNHGEMGIGSGIVAESDPIHEWEECWLKGGFLLNPVPDFQLIETMLCRPRAGIWLLDEHLDRLRSSAKYWGFSLAEAAIGKTLAEVPPKTDGVDPLESCFKVRLLVSKDGRFEIKMTPCPHPVLSVEDAPAAIVPGKVAYATSKIHSSDPYLYHKTTRRTLYNEERNAAVDRGCFDVLFTNERGEVTEGSICNLFVRKDGLWLTPSRECGLLGGVLRDFLLKNGMPGSAHPPLREAVLTRADLDQAEAIYLGNSVRGLVRVELESKTDESV
ncbi:MAG: aminodeoxychorismate synthase component I [Proteobacteria bacterium]|nr:aminodeoxychorismate synthase component I [Pseudomonadota bacterium]